MTRPNEALAPALVERVLGKLGVDRKPSATLPGLALLYERWCRSVSFDNVRKLIHVRRGDPATLPGDAPSDFFESWLLDGCGATCWAANGALHALLHALGFKSQRLMATMLVAPDLPPNHGSVAVRIDDTDYLVDASMLHVDPLPMRPGEESRVDHPAWGLTARWVDGHFTVRWYNFVIQSWMDCRIDRAGATAVDFSTFHEATRAWSPFNFGLSLNSIRGGHRVGAAAGCILRIDDGGDRSVRPVDLDERRRFLVEEIGMSERIVELLPEDLPMTPPPWSRSSSA